MIAALAALTLAALALAPAPARALEYAERVEYWTQLDFQWDALHTRQAYLDSGAWVPDNCALTGLKLYGDRTFVSVPRWRPGVPATLNEVVDGVLAPYPSWDMNAVGSITYVQSMEIDAARGQMWIVDVGRQNLLDAAELVNGQAKLLVWDIDNDVLVRQHNFSDAVLPFDASFANDIVLDPERRVAYISDAGGDGAIVVYDWDSDSARRYAGASTAAEPDVPFVIDGVDYGTDTFTTPEDGIALSPDFGTLYYCALQGLTLYSLPTDALRDFSKTDAELDALVTAEGTKAGPSDGLAYSNNGMLYFGSLTGSTLYAWEPDAGYAVEDAEIELLYPSTDYQWIDTFAFDGQGYLYFTVNYLDEYIVDGLSPGFAIMRTYVAGNSYMNGAAADDDHVVVVGGDDDDDDGHHDDGHHDDDSSSSAGEIELIVALVGTVLLVAGAAYLYEARQDRAKLRREAGESYQRL